MTIESRIQSLVQLGSFLNKHAEPRAELDSEFELAINRAIIYNGWFTSKNVRKALSAIVEMLTEDQLKLLKYDNITSGKYKTNSDIGVPSERYFDEEVKKYCYMWREGGQFSTEKYNSKNNSDVNLN